MNLGDRIKLCRKNENLSREELADKIGLSKFAITKYEQGQRTPKIDVIKKICAALNIDMSYLLEPKFVNSIRLNKLLSDKNLSISDIINVLNLDTNLIKKFSNNCEIINKSDILALEKISDYLNVNPEYILGKSEFKFYEEWAFESFECLIEEIRINENDATRQIFCDIAHIFSNTLTSSLSCNRIEELQYIKNFYNLFYIFKDSLTKNCELRMERLNNTFSDEEFNSIVSNFKSNISNQIDIMVQYYKDIDRWKNDDRFDPSKFDSYLFDMIMNNPSAFKDYYNSMPNNLKNEQSSKYFETFINKAIEHSKIK